MLLRLSAAAYAVFIVALFSSLVYAKPKCDIEKIGWGAPIVVLSLFFVAVVFAYFIGHDDGESI